MTKRARGSGRVYQRGNRWWIAWYRRVNGKAKQIREPGGDTERQARDLLIERLASVKTGRFIGREHERLTVSETLDAYVAELRNRRRKSLVQIESHLKPVRAALGDLRVLELTVASSNRYIAGRRAQGIADGTLGQELMFLRCAVTLAQRQGRLPVAPYIPSVGPGGTRKVSPGVEVFDAIHAQLADDYRDAAEFAWLTGWRYGEITALCWEHVFRGAAEIRLPDSKNGHGRVIALTGRLHELIEGRWRARRLDCAQVFHHRSGRPIQDALREQWRLAGQRAGFPDVEVIGAYGKTRRFAAYRLHDLRRSALRNLRRAGVAESIAMSISGHQNASVFRRYDIIESADQAIALAAADAHRREERAAMKVVGMRKAMAAPPARGQ